MGWTVYSEENLDADPGWTIDNGRFSAAQGWSFGQPTGEAQDIYGGPDPTSGHTGDLVYGVNLDGDAPASVLDNELTLTTPSIDLSAATSVQLSFWRWLGVERDLYDNARIRLSVDGGPWTLLWETDDVTIDESAWSYHTFDLSVAAGSADVRIQWSYGLADSAWQYCGWNIDDIRVEGSAPCGPSDPSSSTASRAPIATPGAIARACCRRFRWRRRLDRGQCAAPQPRGQFAFRSQRSGVGWFTHGRGCPALSFVAIRRPPAGGSRGRACGPGAILVEPVALLTVMERLEEQDFYLDQHRIVYGACLGLQQKGRAADLLTVTNHLREEGLLERVGGPVAVSALVDALPDVANVGHYADIVLDKAVKRRLMHAARSILDTCAVDSGEAKAAVEQAQKVVYEIAEGAIGGGLMPIGRLTEREIVALEKAQETHSSLTGIDTGYYDLNDKTSGLQPTDLVILAARPAMGKTSLAMNICTHVALRSRKKVAIFSLEMSAEQLVRRLLSAEARVDQQRLRTGYLAKADWPKITEVSENLKGADLWIDDTPGITVMELAAKARRLKQEHGLDLVMVNYLQLMSGGRRYSNRNEEVSEISRGLKGVAKNLGVPMLVLSQLSRRPEQRGSDRRPQLSDLRESGSIEQDADVVMFIVRPSIYDTEADKREAELIVAKQRNGPTGEIKLVFQYEYTRFENAGQSRPDENQPF